MKKNTISPSPSHCAYQVLEKADLPLVILRAFGEGQLHICSLGGNWNMQKAVAENEAALIYSKQHQVEEKGDEQFSWSDLIFQFEQRAFLYVDGYNIYGIASTPRKPRR